MSFSLTSDSLGKAGNNIIKNQYGKDPNFTQQTGDRQGQNSNGSTNVFNTRYGSTTIGASNSGFNKEGIAVATVGGGNITTGSDVTDLNRNTNESMLITKNERVGGLDGSLTVDNKAITDTAEYFSSLGAYGRLMNIVKIMKYSDYAFQNYDEQIKVGQNPNDPEAHNKSREAFNDYVAKPGASAAGATLVEIGQFVYYGLTYAVGTQSLYDSFGIWDGKGNAPDLSGSSYREDFVNDINGAVNGATGNRNYLKTQEDLNKFNQLIFEKNDKK